MPLRPRASGAGDAGVAGEAAALYDVSTTSNNDLVNIIPVAIVAIAILLALVLRSLVAPLYLIVSVAFSYLAALGVATIVFIDIAGESGLTLHPAVPDVHLPARARRGLQHPRDDTDPRGGTRATR